MTYGYRPADWAAFAAELARRDIAIDDIEKVELRPALADPGATVVTVTLRSGRVESWQALRPAG